MPDNVYEMLKGKSFKREIAGALLFLWYAAWVFVLFGDNIALMEARAAVLGLASGPVHLFAGAAYGMHSYVKQYTPMKANAERIKKAPITDEEVQALKHANVRGVSQ